MLYAAQNKKDFEIFIAAGDAAKPAETARAKPREGNPTSGASPRTNRRESVALPEGQTVAFWQREPRIILTSAASCVDC